MSQVLAQVNDLGSPASIAKALCNAVPLILMLPINFPPMFNMGEVLLSNTCVAVCSELGLYECTCGVFFKSSLDLEVNLSQA